MRTASTSRIGKRVRILPNMGRIDEFTGKTGVITNTEMEYYRVELDEPVMVEGVGFVEDDLWIGSLLRNIPEPKPSKPKVNLREAFLTHPDYIPE